MNKSEQITIAQVVQLTGLHENTIRRFIKKALATDPKATTKIIRTRRGYRLDRAYVLAGLGQESPQPPAAARTTQDHSQHKRQTVKITIWARPAAKRELERIAKDEGLSLSCTGATALEEWLARQSHIQHRGIFQPMIERAIAKEMRAYSSRLAMLSVRSLFTSEQIRAIAYNILRKQPGMTDERVDTIMDGSKNTAKRNIAQVDPELIPVIGAIETWLAQGAGEAHD